MPVPKVYLKNSEKLFHPPYSPDVAPDYYLFRSLQNNLAVLMLSLREEVEHEAVSYLMSKQRKVASINLLTDGIKQLSSSKVQTQRIHFSRLPKTYMANKIY